MSIQDAFLGAKPCLTKHVELCMTKENDYIKELQTICDKGVISTLSQPNKAMILATLHMTGHTKLLPNFLKHCDVVAIVKACQILDRPRLIKQLEQKIAVIEHAHPVLLEEAKQDEVVVKRSAHHKFKHKNNRKHKREERSNGNGEQIKKKRKRKIDIHRAKLKSAQSLLFGSGGANDLGCVSANQVSAEKEIISSASLSGAFAKKVRRWASQLKADFLEFIVMSGSMNLWKELADWVHFAPGDFALPYFLSAAHGGALPEDSFVCGMRSLIDAPSEKLTEIFQAVAEKYPQVYQAFNFLRMHDHLLRNKDIAMLLAANVPISTAIWYLEEIALSAPTEVAAIVARRMETSNWKDDSSKVTESFGKLVERILTFRSRGWTDVADHLKPAAGRRLSALKEKWATASSTASDGLTVIFGDKSASMQSAIEAATIIAAMVSTCFQGELSFFDDDNVESPYKRPATVNHVLEIAQTICADNSTSMATALWPYYERQEKLSRIILVSDEGENTTCNSYNFAPLLKKYKEEVFDGVELISICVGSGCWSFRHALVEASIDCKRIEIDGYRPDLSKFDTLLGQIALLSRKQAEAGDEAASLDGKDDFVVLEEQTES
ncbi:hypothetical protein ACA910_003901 [Epithemia clementina (nom. ined.)]